MIARFNLSNSNDGGGIKGLVEAYKAHGVVDAGDFVQFASDYSSTEKSNDTKLSSTNDTVLVISAVALSDNKIFIAYYSSLTSDTDYIYRNSLHNKWYSNNSRNRNKINYSWLLGRNICSSFE